jgi:hypothetical protein
MGDLWLGHLQVSRTACQHEKLSLREGSPTTKVGSPLLTEFAVEATKEVRVAKEKDVVDVAFATAVRLFNFSTISRSSSLSKQRVLILYPSHWV